jgi:hypothetical protein
MIKDGPEVSMAANRSPSTLEALLASIRPDTEKL